MGLFFTPKKIFSKKELKSSNYRKSPAMKELMNDPVFKDVLDSPREQKEFYKKLYRNGHRDGITKAELDQELKEFSHGHKDHINDKESDKLRHALFKDGTKYHSDYSDDKPTPDKHDSGGETPKKKSGWFW